MVLDDDAHYLPGLQHALRDPGDDPANGAQGALLKMRQCMAGHAQRRAGKASGCTYADAPSRATAPSADAATPPSDTGRASSCCGAAAPSYAA